MFVRFICEHNYRCEGEGALAVLCENFFQRGPEAKQ